MIEVQSLTKRYGSVVAVDRLTFTVPKGQVLGFLGPNGAGKSTTMKMLTCFIEPSSGTASVGGKDIFQDTRGVRSMIGYLPESAPSYGEMTVFEFLSFIAQMRGLIGDKKKTALAKMREICHLESVWDQPIETLSKGYKQRVGFAQALIHDPPVLILDEPTDGLDPNQKHEVRQLIRQMKEDKTIILSTHILEEVDAVCQRAVIIAHGKIVADSTPQKLMEYSESHNAVVLQIGKMSLEAVKSDLSLLRDVEKVEVLSSPNTLRVFPRKGQPLIDTLSSLAREKNWPIENVQVEQGKLDEVFRKVTIGSMRIGV